MIFLRDSCHVHIQGVLRLLFNVTEIKSNYHTYVHIFGIFFFLISNDLKKKTLTLKKTFY